MKSFGRNGLLLLLLGALMVPAMAADKPAKDATKRLQQQLRKTEQEKSQAIAAKAEVDAKLKEVLDKVGVAESRADKSEVRSAQLSRELKTLKAEKESLAAEKLAEATALNKRLADAELRMSEQKNAFDAEKARLGSISQKQLAALSGCSDRNAKMYKLGNELLDKYEQKGCWDAALQAEPFTGLHRAKIEKMIEQDREQLDNNELLPVQGAAPSGIESEARP